MRSWFTGQLGSSAPSSPHQVQINHLTALDSLQGCHHHHPYFAEEENSLADVSHLAVLSLASIYTGNTASQGGHVPPSNF